MKKRPVVVVVSILIAVSAAVAFVGPLLGTQEAAAVSDPRREPPFVRLVTPAPVIGSERGFTGIIGARVQSNLGFRVAGKIVARLVNVGQQVNAGQPLMRIDTDLRLALTAKRNAVAAARASVVQTEADERRYAGLVDKGWVSQQRYDQAKAASDTAEAQLAAAEADARVGENEATYSVLVADADGTVVETLGEPGQVVAAGQTVVRLAQAGPREAVVALPETILQRLDRGETHGCAARSARGNMGDQLSRQPQAIGLGLSRLFVAESSSESSRLLLTVPAFHMPRRECGDSGRYGKVEK